MILSLKRAGVLWLPFPSFSCLERPYAAPPAMLLLSRPVVNWIVGKAADRRSQGWPGAETCAVHRSGLCPPRCKTQQRSNPLVAHARIQKRTGVTCCQHRARRAARPVVPQHAAEQRPPNPTTPVRRIDIHVGAPRRPCGIHAADAADDV